MSHPSAPPTRFGSYILDRKLAEGGMAEVYLARQGGVSGFEKQVVVKRILPALASHSDFVTMFLNEARLAARLSHSNVVQVIEAGEIDGQYYIAMEYIEGTDLKLFYDEAESSGVPTPPGIACRIVADLLAGLHYAHTVRDDQGRSLGVVHRDVSPQNVLVTRTGTVKIVDFGIAKATHAAVQQTRAGQVKGKIAYLSPEQAMGRPLDARSDVFACGILLWELSTGKRLFARSNDMASIMAITDEEVATVRSIRSELPDALDHLLAQALAKAPGDRYSSAQAMQVDLEALIRGQGWPGDRRTLERHMQARLPSGTPGLGVPAHDPVVVAAKPAAIIKPVSSMSGARLPAVSSFNDEATMLADSQHAPSSVPTSPPPGAAPPAATSLAEAATRAIMTQEAPPPPYAPPQYAPPPPQYVPPPPQYPAPSQVLQATGSMPMPPGYQYGGYRTGASPSHSNGSTGRRIVVVITAAVLVTVGTIAAVDWRPGKTGTPTVGEVEGIRQAQVAIEVSEPAVIDLEGRRTRIDQRADLTLSSGKQITLLATTVRGTGKETTRSIALPPAADGERIPLKINFQP